MRDAYLRIAAAIQGGNRFRREDVVALAEERTMYRKALFDIDAGLSKAASGGPLIFPEQMVQDIVRAALSGAQEATDE